MLQPQPLGPIDPGIQPIDPDLPAGYVATDFTDLPGFLGFTLRGRNDTWTRPLSNPCGQPPHSAHRWCNVSEGLEARAADMVRRMTLDEKINSLHTFSGAIPSLGLDHYTWWTEASHGLLALGAEATAFAFPITMAMTFNRSLWSATGRQIGRETRAYMNMGVGHSTVW